MGLVRPRKKRRKDVYSTDMNRLSVYPSYKRPEEKTGRIQFRRGETIKVRVSGQDDDGRPTGVYKGYRVVIIEGDAMPGEEVMVEVQEYKSGIVYARLK
jgi:predicted RNA-binding protein with TRAM domain